MTRSGHRRGFALLDLIVVLALIFILTSLALPQVNVLTEDAKKTKARQDCDTIVQAIQKYQILEGIKIHSLLDLKSKYLTNIDTLKDPWGQSYRLNLDLALVYSLGPDTRDGEHNAAEARDNICVSWTGPLQLEKAWQETIRGSRDTADPSWDRVLLRLCFNRKVKLTRADFDLADLIAWDYHHPDPDAADPSSTRRPDPFAPRHALRIVGCGPGCRETCPIKRDVLRRKLQESLEERLHGPMHYGLPLVPLSATDPWGHAYRREEPGGAIVSAGPDGRLDRLDRQAPCNVDNLCIPAPPSDTAETSRTDSRLWTGQLPEQWLARNEAFWLASGAIFHTRDSREIILVLPAGSARDFPRTRLQIDLTGNHWNHQEQGNPLFRDFVGVTPAESRGKPLPLETPKGEGQ